MKKLLLCLLLVLLLPLTSALAANQPLYSATAKITGPIYAEMSRESRQVGRIKKNVRPRARQKGC